MVRSAALSSTVDTSADETSSTKPRDCLSAPLQAWGGFEVEPPLALLPPTPSPGMAVELQAQKNKARMRSRARITYDPFVAEPRLAARRRRAVTVARIVTRGRAM